VSSDVKFVGTQRGTLAVLLKKDDPELFIERGLATGESFCGRSPLTHVRAFD
jgi:hypothetical protein